MRVKEQNPYLRLWTINEAREKYNLPPLEPLDKVGLARPSWLYTDTLPPYRRTWYERLLARLLTAYVIWKVIS